MNILFRKSCNRKLHSWRKNFRTGGELALAKEYAQVYRIVMELFDKFVSLLGEEEIALKDYCELLDAGLEEAKVGVIPPSLDQVMIGDVERTRIKNIKALFFVGANDTLYREIQEWADCCLNVTGSSFRRKKSHFLREQKKRFIFRNFICI